MNEENNNGVVKNKNKNSWIFYFLVFFIGCAAMYAVVYYFPVLVTESVTKVEKEVTVTDTGIADAVEKVYDAVVVVQTYSSGTLIASGTGFVYQEDEDTYYLLTNYHVIEDGTEVTVTFTNNDVIETTIVGYDEYADIAVLSLESDDDITVAEIGSSEDLRVGDTAFAVGAPLDSVYSWTVTRGIISGKDRLVEVSLSSSSTSDYAMLVLQTDAAINSGNSGGPLCNSNGEVIGITSLKLVSDGVEGMGFAIPIETAIATADKIISGEVIEYPYLGISMLDVSSLSSNSKYYSLIRGTDITSGVLVASVVDGSPAEDGGVETGDIITAINDQSVTSVAYLKYYLYQYSVGDTISLTVYRNGSEKTISVKLGTSNQTT